MKKEEETIKTIKGFDHELKCLDKQYEVGQTYTEDGNPKVCEHGMHAISPDTSPLSVFRYYPPSVNGKPSRYCDKILLLQGGFEMNDKDWAKQAEKTARANGWQPLDPSGISDQIYELKKQGYTTSYDERLAAYHEVQRIY